MSLTTNIERCSGTAGIRGLLIITFGGHARSVADVALDLGIPSLRFVDANARPGEKFAGFPVATRMPDALQEGWRVIAASGDNLMRREQIETALRENLPVMSLVSRRAYVGVGATIMPAAFVAHQAHIGPMATIGRGSIINTAALVEHECLIGEFTHISVNATVAGRCEIGSLAFIGAGATIIDGIRITDRVIIGAGSTVIEDVVEAGVYVGCPARRIDCGA